MIKSPRGTRDLLPPSTDLWNQVDARAREVFTRYNFHEIRTPIFESTELFARGVGEETDIVSKEMYTWNDTPRLKEDRMYELWKEKHQNEFDEIIDIVSNRESGVDVAAYSNDRVVLVELKTNPFYSRVALMRWLEIANKTKEAWNDPKGRRLETILVLPITFKMPSEFLRGVDVQVEYLDNDELLDFGQSLTLRPENTAGVVRAYIEHNLGQSGLLQKLYYIGPQFRRERPQKGRFRQFYQIGAEIIGPPTAGSESPARDAEVIEMLATLLDELGVRGWSLQLNSVGCAADRARYNEALKAALQSVVHQMCADCQRRAETNPLRVLDCKVPADQPIIEKLPKIGEYLDEPCRAHFDEVKAMLDAVGVQYEVNQRMVRGLDYYTRTTFEFTHGELGAQSAILGGGRYDGLSEALGGPKAPGIGFAMGEDRLVMILEAQGAQPERKLAAYIAPIGAGMNREALKLARELRRQGIAVEAGEESFRLKKAFETAEKLGAEYAIILGENELKSGALNVKDLRAGEQRTIPRTQLTEHLRKARSS